MLEAVTGKTPEKPPGVLMIHGLGGTQYDLGSMHKVLKNAGFVTHSLTLPGHGTVPEDLLGVRAEDWIEAVRKLYREIEAQHDVLHICGMCMGALLATQLAKEERHVKGRLVALAPPIFLDGWATPWYAALRGLLYWSPALRHRMRIEEEEPFGIKNELVRSIVKAKFKRGEAFHYRWVPLHCVQQVDRLRKMVMAGLDRIECPTLVCHAREDELTSLRSAEYLQREIGPAKTTVVALENSYHMICVDNDRELVASSMLRHFGVDPAMALRRPRRGARTEEKQMSQNEVLKVAQEYYGALVNQQFEPLLKLFASEVVWHQPGSHQLAGDYSGRSELITLFSKLMELSGGTFRFIDASAVMASDQLAAATLRFSATRAGRQIDAGALSVLRLSGGKVAEVWHFPRDPAAENEFWGGSAPKRDEAASAAPAPSVLAAPAPAIDLDSGDLAARFERAAAALRLLPQQPDNDTLLRLYAFYKQGSAGNVRGERPGMMDLVGRAKYDAWAKLDGTPGDDARKQYVALVKSLMTRRP